jgi:hypothetical protein
MTEFTGPLHDRIWVETLKDDLAAVNNGKTDRPFQFTDTIIGWAIMIHTALHIGYRLTLGSLNV